MFFIEYFHSVRAKLFLLLFTFFYVVFMFWWVLNSFRSDDPIPTVSTVDLLTRKKTTGGLTTSVKSGLYIKN